MAASVTDKAGGVSTKIKSYSPLHLTMSSFITFESSKSVGEDEESNVPAGMIDKFGSDGITNGRSDAGWF